MGLHMLFGMNSVWFALLGLSSPHPADLVRNISPSVATRVARETTQLARTTIAKLDPRRVEDAVRRVAETIDLDGKGKKNRRSGGTRLDRIARAAIAKIGPERAVKMAAEATRALKRLVAGLDPDQVARRSGNPWRPPRPRTTRRVAFEWLDSSRLYWAR